MIKGGIIQQVIPWDGVIELPTDILLEELASIELPTDIVLEEVTSVVDIPTGIQVATVEIEVIINYDLTTTYDEQTNYS